MNVVHCRRCTEAEGHPVEHRLSNGAIREILVNAQRGDLSTVKNNTVCLYALFGDDIREMSDAA